MKLIFFSRLLAYISIVRKTPFQLNASTKANVCFCVFVVLLTSVTRFDSKQNKTWREFFWSLFFFCISTIDPYCIKLSSNPVQPKMYSCISVRLLLVLFAISPSILSHRRKFKIRMDFQFNNLQNFNLYKLCVCMHAGKFVFSYLINPFRSRFYWEHLIISINLNYVLSFDSLCQLLYQEIEEGYEKCIHAQFIHTRFS